LQIAANCKAIFGIRIYNTIIKIVHRWNTRFCKRVAKLSKKGVDGKLA
jgi:hypothetical protein